LIVILEVEMKVRASVLSILVLASLAVAGENAKLPEPSAAVKAKFAPNTWVPIKWKMKILEGAVPPGVKTGRHTAPHWYGGLTYRADTGETLVMDGYGESFNKSVLGTPGIYANAVYSMDPVTGTYTLWKVCNYHRNFVPTKLNLKDPTPSPRHTYGCWTYVPGKKSVYIWTGANKKNGYAARQETKDAIKKHVSHKRWINSRGQQTLGMWRYDFEKKKWITIDKSKVYPPGGYEHETVWFPKTRRLYFFSGSRPRGRRNTVYSFDLEKEQWTDEKASMMPRGVWGCTAFVDAKRDRIVFNNAPPRKGGDDAKFEMLAYYPEKKKAEPVAVKGVKPKARTTDGFCYNSRHDLYVLYGGSGKVDDNWVFDPKTSEWKKFEPVKNIPVGYDKRRKRPSQSFVMMVYDSKNDLMVMCRTGGPGRWYAMRFVPEKAKWAKPAKAK
jgi:hypothetical protein